MNRHNVKIAGLQQNSISFEGKHEILQRTTHPHQSTAALNEKPSKQYVYYVIGLLFVVNVCNYVDRLALAVLSPQIKADLDLSDGQLGLLMGFAFAMFYAIAGIPVARWADRGIRRNIITLALMTWSVMTAVSGAAQNFWHLFLARVGVGTGEAGCVPTAQSIICDYVPVNRRAGVLAFHYFGQIVSMVVGMSAAGWLMGVIGWRWAFVVLGLPGVLLALVVRLTLREPLRGRFDASGPKERTGAAEPDRPSIRETFTALWTCRTYRRLMIAGVLISVVQYGLSQWWPSFYSRVFGISASSVGVYLGTAIGVGSGLGLLIGGWWSNKLGQRDLKRPLQLSFLGYLLATPVAAVSLFMPSASGSLVLVGLTGLLWSIPTGPSMAATYSVIPSHMRATAGAMMIFFSSVLAMTLGPLSIGVLSDLLTPTFGVEALRYALLVPLVLIPLGVVSAYAAAQSVTSDLKATGIRM